MSAFALTVALAIAAPLLVMLAVAAHNWRRFPRLTPAPAAPAAAGLPFVSVLIPARNEAAQIGTIVAHLLAQEYAGDWELIVLDDHSEDSTAERARAAGSHDPRLRVLSGLPLPAGWTGKNWACQQLAEAARGENLLFTDADVQWEAQALIAVVGEALSARAGLLAVWPTQIMQSWSERLVVPLVSFTVLAYLPVSWAHNLPYPAAAAANGQCLLFTRRAYAACGGHAAVAASVLDDVTLARAVKAAGHTLRMCDGNGLVQTRMYRDWPAVRDGLAKSILAGHGNSVPLLLLSTLFHLLIFVLPWLWLLWGGAGWPLLPALLVALGVGVRTLTALTARQPLAEALLMPISVLLMARIALHAIWWRLRLGGPQWRGRTYRLDAQRRETRTGGRE